MTITAQSIIQRATDQLQDPTSVKWTCNELVRWLNDAQRAIAKVRPDLMNTTETMTCAAGARQDLDTAGLAKTPSKLIDVIRNMATGSTKGAVTKVDIKIMKTIRDWFTFTPSITILHFIFDERDPKTFYTYPPALSTAQIEITYSAFPTDITAVADGSLYTAVTGNLSVPDTAADDVLDLVLARAYGKDAEFAANAAREAFYIAKVEKSLGAEIAATIAVSPK